MSAHEPNYHCPKCGRLSELVISETQAFCRTDPGCDVICFNPSLPDGGMSNLQVIDWSKVEKPEQD